MQISFSDYLASIALVVSLASAYYAKKQSEYARISSRNDYRAYLSDNHKKYHAALLEVQNRHKAELSNLSKHAGVALTAIVRMFDEYDAEHNVLPYLRHLVHEASEMVYCAFKGQLGWQTGLNISHRFYQMRHLEDRLKPTKSYSGNEDFRRSLQNIYQADRNAYQETELLSDLYFNNLIGQTKKRIDSERAPEIILRMQEILQSFNEMYCELKPRLEESADYLEGLLREGELEHFPLRESFQIYDAIRYKRATLNALAHLKFPTVEPEYSHSIYNYTSLSIYICALLHAIKGFHSWGWKYSQ